MRKLGPKLLQKVTIEIIEYEDLPLARLHLCQFQPPLDTLSRFLSPDTLFFQPMYSLQVHCDYRQTSIPGVELVSCHPSKQHGTSVSVPASCRRVLIVRVPTPNSEDWTPVGYVIHEVCWARVLE